MMKKMKNFALILGITGLISFTTKAQTIEEAIKHLDAERYTAATKAFNHLAETSPNATTLFYKGYSILKSPEGVTPQSLKSAEEAFQAGDATEKRGDALCQVGLGMVKLANKDFAGAKVIFDEVKKSTKSKNTDVLFRIGEAYTMFPNATDPAEAIMNIDLALEKSKVKDNPEYYMAKSDAYLIKNEGGDAMNALQNAERIGGSKLGKIYEKMARVWLQGRNYKEASEVIDKGIAADPTHAPIYKYQSSFLQTMGKYGESAKAARKYLDNSDGDCKAKLRYAKLAFVAKDFDSVKKMVEEIKACSSDPYVYRMQGIINFEEKKPEEAITELRKFIEKVPADENPALDYGYIGRSYMIMPGEGDAKKMTDSLGILNIEKAVQLGDTTFNYYQDLFSTFVARRDYANAAKYSEKATLAKKDANAADYATVGTYYSAAQNWNKADEYIDKALAEYKGLWPDGYALSARVKTYKNSGDSTFSANYSVAPIYEKYLSLLDDAAKAEKKNNRNVSEAYTYLAGKEFLINKDVNKAIALIEELLKFDPENEKAKAQLLAIKTSAGLIKETP
jgi:tetratricopeptide (TPR) repeat protein